MADYDFRSESKTLAFFGPVALDADNTPTALDTAGFRAITVQTFVGIGGITFSASNRVDFKLFHGDDATYGNATAVEAADVVMPNGETLGAGGIIRSLIAAKAAADTEVHTVGYIGKKRYLYVLADFDGTHGAATPMAAAAIMNEADVKPVWQAAVEV